MEKGEQIMMNIRFEPELYQQLLAEAKRTGTSIPALVCQLLKPS